MIIRTRMGPISDFQDIDKDLVIGDIVTGQTF